MAKAAKKRIEPVLKAGWWVAVTLKPDTAPLRAYVGRIQAIGDDGMRLTLIDWASGMAEGWDFYIPHLKCRECANRYRQSRREGFWGSGWHMAGTDG